MLLQMPSRSVNIVMACAHPLVGKDGWLTVAKLVPSDEVITAQRGAIDFDVTSIHYFGPTLDDFILLRKESDRIGFAISVHDEIGRVLFDLIENEAIERGGNTPVLLVTKQFDFAWRGFPICRAG